MVSIRIIKRLVKPVLYMSRVFNDNYFILVCKGYNEDYDNYTGLYWNEDKDLDTNDNSYEDFQIWLNLFPKFRKK